MSASYEPGVCNIGGDERRRRYRYAAVCVLAAVAYLAGVVALGAPTALLVGLVVPLALGTELFLQARRAFCAALGVRGRYAFDGDTGTAPDATALETDRRYAGWLTALGVAGGAGLTAVVVAVVTIAGW